MLLRQTLRSVVEQMTEKFVYSKVPGDYKASEVKKALEMLTMAGLIIPVTHSDANGIPLGSEADANYRKMLLLDTGLALRLLNMATGSSNELTTHILTSNEVDFVNKGPMAEMVAGLEMLHNKTPNLRHELYYWHRMAKNSNSEVDYINTFNQNVLPIEVKAGKQGGMKSLWLFMREKNIHSAIRCSLENYGEFDYIDKEADNEVRHVRICPLFALSQLETNVCKF